VETPEAPREGNAARLGKSAEARGLAGASWVGRGDEQRHGSWLGLVFAILLVLLAAPRLPGLWRSAR
jgi:hypothetical protein